MSRTVNTEKMIWRLLQWWVHTEPENPTDPLPYLLNLLVNDDDLLRVDLEKQQNLLRVTDPQTGEMRYEDVTVKENEDLTSELIIRDAPTLLPVNIPADQVRQFWVTVHVPADAAPGHYKGSLTVQCAGSAAAVLPLAAATVNLSVLTITIPPALRSGMFLFRAAGFMATRTEGSSPGVRIFEEEK